MKNNSNNSTKRRWPRALLLQILCAFAAGFITALCMGLHPIAAAMALWLFMPCAGAFTAFRAVLRGLLNYAAWLAPPVCLYAAYCALWGYAPPAGAALLTAFFALVGAAAGEVYTHSRK